jgi:hypothetical protein
MLTPSRRLTARRPAPRIGPRTLAALGPQRVVLRLQLPEELLGVIRFGQRHPRAAGARFWSAVEDELRVWLRSHTPEDALRVDVALAPGARDVIASVLVPSGLARDGS